MMIKSSIPIILGVGSVICVAAFIFNKAVIVLTRMKKRERYFDILSVARGILISIVVLLTYLIFLSN